jgi:AraC-like DNA-binding protein
MSIPALVANLNPRFGNGYSEVAPGLGLTRSTEPYGFEAMIYEPLVCLILQGEKETVVGGVSTRVRVGELIVVSHALPVTARVVEARPDAPYLSLIAHLDLGLLRSVMVDLDAEPARGQSTGFRVGLADAGLVDVFGRYVALADDPVDARVLGPQVRRELHYRLLRSGSAGMLRSLFDRSGHSQNIARAIHELRASFRRPMDMDLLAQAVGMSASSFYKHFKAITATTPLQYQKELRLTEARRLLLSGQTVNGAAFAVGYRSPSQFSRDYGRRFGSPPSASRPGAQA